MDPSCVPTLQLIPSDGTILCTGHYEAVIAPAVIDSYTNPKPEDYPLGGACAWERVAAMAETRVPLPGGDHA